MKEQFVTYKIALKLKELGFDEECLAYYSKEPVYEDKDGNKTNFVLLSAKNKGELIGHGTCKNSLFQWLKDNDKTYGELYTLSESIAAPLWQQVIDWFYGKGIFIIINMDITSMWVYQVGPGFPPMEKIIPQWITSYYVYNNPNEAREQAILKCIELLKNK